MEDESNIIRETPVSFSEELSGNQHREQAVGFSRVWTVICTVIVSCGMGVLVWAYDSLTAIEHVEKPERALAHITARSMVLESLQERTETWERSFYEMLNDQEDSSTQLIEWYDELARTSPDPLSSLYAAMLEGESEQVDKMNLRIESWGEQAEPFPFFQSMLKTAYEKGTYDSDQMTILQARLAEEVPSNWFYSQLSLRLATQAENLALRNLAQEQMAARVDELFWRNRLLVITEVSLAVLSVCALVFLMWRSYRKGHDAFRISHASLPPPWLGRDGFAVLMRGGAVTLLFLTGLGALLGAYFSFVDGEVDSKFMELVSSFLLYAPIPVLLYYYLLRPRHHSLGQVFGLHVRSGKMGMLVFTVLALFACGMIGDLAVSMAGEAIGKSTHWTEWFNDSLVWGGTSDLIILFLEVVVLAPVFEEFIFRGIVFASLRRQFGWWLSAVLSAAIFAVVHGYGIVGLGAVGWSGFLWAWAYEKTGSLWPGIMAHALNNFVFLASLLVVFR